MSSVKIDRLSPKLRVAYRSRKALSDAAVENGIRRAEIQKRIKTLQQMALFAAEKDPQKAESYADCGGYLTGYVQAVEGWDDDEVYFIESVPHQIHE
ncbi:hypothetical protein [Phyllobacterium bourgognense]|uniref:Uncharacterized protein n=1 Tax=Phyllobacterium bourgognense TaxID=314236 RepID=A0A368ZAW0_9HYPH|nr:hypothetical protein [Phyllobacterium bourgognense]RCW87594.1 hypothetical protein C7476_101360 [Phyllobacterium bourgognense]